MILYQTTESTTMPLGLKETKQQLRLSTAITAEDDLLSAYIRTAYQYAENMCEMSIVPHTWVLKLNGFPGSTGHIDLPMCRPMSTAASPVVVKFLLDDTVTTGTTYTLAATRYVVSTFSDPPKLYPSYGNEWPSSVRTDPHEGNVIITYNAGYATLSASMVDVPADIKSWLKIRVADMYENRQALQVKGGVAPLPRSYVDGILDRYKVGRL